MKYIKQKTENDCGIAAIAMATGESYKEIRRVIYGIKKLTDTPFTGMTRDDAHMICHLKGHSFDSTVVDDTNRVTLAKELKGTSAVLITPAKYYRSGSEYHAVFWTGSELWDPSEDGFKKDGRRVLKRMEEIWWINRDAPVE